MKSVFISLALMACVTTSVGQKAIEDEIKKVVIAETESFIAGDTLKWLSTWKQD
jgi:hypothetical protein